MDPRDILIDQFDYRLPEEKIARYPLAERHQSKLLVWRNGSITDAVFSEIIHFIPKNALLVFNESGVINARLFFKNNKGATIEVFCLEPDEEVSKALSAKGEVSWRCLVGGLRKWKQDILTLEIGELTLSARILDRRKEDIIVRFSWTPPDRSFAEVLAEAGVLPVPPYLNRESEEIDKTRYQTVYAGDQGSVAAPTAGLHFTPEILAALEKQGTKSVKLSLHVGSGTFKPVKSESLAGHDMHTEWLTVTLEGLELILGATRSGSPVITVGTTSLRALESMYWLGVRLLNNMNVADLTVYQWDPYAVQPEEVSPEKSLETVITYLKTKGQNKVYCRTSLLIAPPYRPMIAKALITNFHQPRSTLLLLVAAFTGGNWKKIYDHALAGNYRFLSYGDSSLLFT